MQKFYEKDDIILFRGNCIEILNSMCSEKKYDMIWMDSFECNPGGIKFKKSSREVDYLWYGMPTHHQAIFFRSDLVCKFKYNTSYRIAADYDLICKIASQENCKIKVLHSPLCVFELGGASSKKFYQGLIEQQKIRKNQLGVGVLKNALIFTLKFFGREFRKNFTPIYNLVRYKK